MKRLFVAIGVAFSLFSLVLPQVASSRSLGVQPLIVEVAPGQSAAVRVRNSSDQPMTVETSISERQIDANGVQARVEADDSFIVFPPQATIPALGTQVFRVQPLDSDLTMSKSYFMTVGQVPVEFTPTEAREVGAQLQVLFAFDVAIHVVPRGAKPKLELVSSQLGQMTLTIARTAAELASSEPLPPSQTKTVPAAVIAIRNDGNRYLYLQDYEFALSGLLSDGTTVSFPDLTQKQIIEAAGVTLVAPNGSRTFSLPLPEGAAVTSVSVQVRERSGS